MRLRRLPPSFVRALAVLALGALSLSVSPSIARADDNTAVELTKQAGELFASGQYQEALERYQRADALVRRQTIVLRIARCLDKLGRLGEALGRYQAVLDMELSPDLEPRKRALQEEAIQQAKTERESLLGRIPTVTIRVSGPADAVAAARVTIDEKPIEPTSLGAPIQLDPGDHAIAVRSADEEQRSSVTLVASDRKDLEVVLKGTAAIIVDPPPPLVVPPIVEPQHPLDPKGAPDTGKGRRIGGGVVIGFGGAALVLGSIWGGVVIEKHGDLVDACGEDLVCPPPLTRDVDGYNQGRVGSTALLITGSALAAVGVVLVVTALPPRAPKSALVLQPNGVAWRGMF
ncbi:MAG: tetratricopeptide repeat protein [Polyangiaceae bacterium]